MKSKVAFIGSDGYYNTVYTVFDLIDNMLYRGKHSTKSLNKRYDTSNTHLKRKIKKYGRENFVFVYDYFFSTSDEAYEFEENEWATEEWTMRRDTYNLKPGGKGFKAGKFNPMYQNPTKNPCYGKFGNAHPRGGTKNSANHNKIISQTHKGKTVSAESIQKMKNNMPDMSGNNNPFYGKNHTEEAKNKMRKAAKEQKHERSQRVSGKNNPMYNHNRKWFYHPELKVEILSESLPDGYIKGRLPKHLK